MRTQVIVVMGVSGSGKSTVGTALARALKWRFLEGDDLHSVVDKAKMARGEGLTDADRAPWLSLIRIAIQDALHEQKPLVVACSALKADYRKVLQVSARVTFLFLTGSAALLRSRIQHRLGHFASPKLIESQLATLEIPRNVLALDVSVDVNNLVARTLRLLP